MPKIVTYDKGSKRRIKQIRWKLMEVFSLAVLAIILFAATLLVMVWQVEHTHPRGEPPKDPQMKSAEPTEP